MSKRIKKKPAFTLTAPTAPQAAAVTAEQPSAGPEILRRMLLAVLTLLIVARPFVWGEDAGLLSEFAEPSGMVLTMLTFFACAAWAAWRLWERQGGVHLGAVEITLFLLAVLFIVGANVAAYSRPAWFTAAEWLGLVLLLFLTRQLANRPDEQHGLMTVLLATAVALCAQGVFQAAYQMPQLAKEFRGEPSPTERTVRYAADLRGVAPTPLEQSQQMNQLDKRLVSGPFFRPGSLADCLVLLVPLLGGAVVACVRSKSTPLFTGTVALCGLVAGVVLGMTRDAPAVAALALAALPFIGLQLPARMGGRWVGLIGGLALAAGALYALYATGRFAGDLERWREVWPAAYELTDSRPWTGVGPAQFRFSYPRFMKPDAGYEAADPSSSLLELYADVGLGGVVLLLVALALVVRVTARWWRTDHPEAPAATEPAPSADDKAGEIRWEYYLGGMLATILSFTLRASAVAPQEVTTEAIAAGIRSVCWFTTFALFERVSWTPREYVGSLVVGVVAMLLAFVVGPGLSFAAVASLLWVAVGLILAIVRPEPAAWRLPALVTRVVPNLGMRFGVGLILAATAAVGVVYFTFALYPASVGTNAIREARFQRLKLIADETKMREDREIKDREKFLREEVIERLAHASKEDASNARVRSVLAQSHLALWREVSEPQRLDRVANDTLKQAKAARQLNPEGEEGYLAEYDLQATVGGTFYYYWRAPSRVIRRAALASAFPAGSEDESDLPAKLRETYDNAAEALRPYLKRDPHNPDLRYRMAHVLERAGHKGEAEDFAREALEIDEKVGKDRPRNLSDPQRKRLREILGKQSAP